MARTVVGLHAGTNTSTRQTHRPSTRVHARTFWKASFISAFSLARFSSLNFSADCRARLSRSALAGRHKKWSERKGRLKSGPVAKALQNQVHQQKACLGHPKQTTTTKIYRRVALVPSSSAAAAFHTFSSFSFRSFCTSSNSASRSAASQHDKSRKWEGARAVKGSGQPTRNCQKI